MSKSALQELIEYFNERPEYDKTSEGYEIIEKAKQLLEKEKEQIINAYNQNMTGFDKLQQEEIGLNWAEDYYNQTYNLKQHIIDIMKADEDDGLYN